MFINVEFIRSKIIHVYGEVSIVASSLRRWLFSSGCSLVNFYLFMRVVLDFARIRSQKRKMYVENAESHALNEVSYW